MKQLQNQRLFWGKRQTITEEKLNIPEERGFCQVCNNMVISITNSCTCYYASLNKGILFWISKRATQFWISLSQFYNKSKYFKALNEDVHGTYTRYSCGTSSGLNQERCLRDVCVLDMSARRRPNEGFYSTLKHTEFKLTGRPRLNSDW